MVCKSCGKTIPDDSVFCHFCGTKVETETTTQKSRFCTSCGAQIPDGVKFCPKCGASVSGTQPSYQKPAPQNQQPQSVQQTYTQKQTQTYSAPPVKKKKGKGGVVVLVVILILAVGVTCFLGFRDGGFFRKGSKRIVDKSGSISMLEYAKQLEEAGNYEAAAAVYSLITKTESARLLQEARENNEVIGIVDEAESITDFFGDVGGGN